MSTLELRSVILPGGETIGYRESGSGGKAVLLVHGNMVSSRHFEPLMINFPAGFKVYALDLPGFGISSYRRQVSSLRDFSDAVAQFADFLRIPRFSLLGWSLGGGVAMQFACDRPDRVERLVLLASIGVRGHQVLRKDENGKPIPGAFLKTRAEIASDPVQVTPVLWAYKTRDTKILRYMWDTFIYTHNKPPEDEFAEYLQDNLTQRNYVDVLYALSRFNISSQGNGVSAGTGEIQKIGMPTLLIHGDRDYVLPLGTAVETRDAIGANARLTVLPDTGHSPLVDSLGALISETSNFLTA